jgi:hypothetical protein
LHDLYDHSLKSVDPFYKEQSSWLFQMMLFHTNTCAGLPLPELLLQFSNVEHGFEPNTIPIRSITMKEKLKAIRMVTARIESRSGGMVEVPQKRDHSGYRLHEPTVAFSHDTVRQYLQQELFREESTPESRSDWSPAHALILSSIQWVRTYSTSEDFDASVSSDSAGPIGLVRTLVTQYLRLMGPTSESYNQDLLNDFEDAVRQRSNLESKHIVN